jgi:hypothetical protein
MRQSAFLQQQGPPILLRFFFLPANTKQSSGTSRETILSKLCLVVAAGESSGGPSARSHPLLIRCRLRVRASSRPAHPTTRTNYRTPTQRGFSPFSAGCLRGASSLRRAATPGVQTAAGRAIRQRNRLQTHVLPSASSLCAAAAAAARQRVDAERGEPPRWRVACHCDGSPQRNHPVLGGEAAATG